VETVRKETGVAPLLKGQTVRPEAKDLVVKAVAREIGKAAVVRMAVAKVDEASGAIGVTTAAGVIVAASKARLKST
jgi:hypothetical protein